MNPMRVSVIIPWRDRPELGEALRKNAALLGEAPSEIVIVNSGGDRELPREIVRGGWCERLVLIELPGAAGLNRSETLNVGAGHSRGGVLFFLDADVLLAPGFLGEALDTMARHECFVSVARVAETQPELSAHPWNPASPIQEKISRTELRHENGHVATVEYSASKDGTRTGSGLMIVRRRHFDAVQGFNSKLLGWGFEDYDLQFRLQLALGIERHSLGRLIHLSHRRPDGGDSNTRNRAICYENYDRGDFLGTLADDEERWRGRTVEETR